MSLLRTGMLVIVLAGFWDWPSINTKVLYGCLGYDLAIAAVFSFALGPAGPGYFFAASSAALAACGSKAIGF